MEILRRFLQLVNGNKGQPSIPVRPSQPRPSRVKNKVIAPGNSKAGRRLLWRNLSRKLERGEYPLVLVEDGNGHTIRKRCLGLTEKGRTRLRRRDWHTAHEVPFRRILREVRR